VYAVNDSPDPVDLEISLEVIPLAPSGPPSGSDASSGKARCGRPRRGLAASARVPGAASAHVAAAAVDALLAAAPGCSRETCFVRATAAPAAAVAAAPAEATVWLAPFKSMPLQDPELVAGGFAPADDSAPGAVKFTVTAPSAAALLALWEAPGLAGRFSANALSLGPCEAREVMFVPSSGDPATPPGDATALAARLEGELRLSSLWDHQRLWSQRGSDGGGKASP
jgi:hypothetical protein